MPGILDSLFGVSPMLDGYLQQANKQSTAFIPQLQDTFSSAYASSLGPKPDIMSARDFIESKGFKPGNPFNFLKKGFGKLGKEYRSYKKDQEAQIGAYDQKITDYNSGLGDTLKNAFGSLSVLMKGNQAEHAYNLKPKLDLTESPSFEGYHYQMGSEVYDPLNATSAIESNHMDGAVSPVGAVSAFQIMGGGALAQYNRDKSTSYSVADVAAKPELAKIVSSYFNDYLYKQAEKKGVTYDSEVTKQIANRMAYYKGESFFSPFKNKKVTMGDLFSDDVPKDVRYHGLKHYNYIKQKNLDLYPENPYSPTYKPSYLHNQYGNTVKRYTEEETHRLLNDPSKYVVSKDPDPTLLYSGIRQVYDREGNQIAYQNREGQFNTLQRGAMRFEGKPSNYTIGVDKEKSYITPYGDPRAQLLSSIAKYRRGGPVNPPKNTIWDRFKRGVQSIGPMGVFNTLANYGSVNPLNPIMDVMAPASIPGNMVQASYTPGVSIGDAVKGQDVEKGLVEEILTDPTLYIGGANSFVKGLRNGLSEVSAFGKTAVSKLSTEDLKRMRAIQSLSSLSLDAGVPRKTLINKFLSSGLSEEEVKRLSGKTVTELENELKQLADNPNIKKEISDNSSIPNITESDWERLRSTMTRDRVISSEFNPDYASSEFIRDIISRPGHDLNILSMYGAAKNLRYTASNVLGETINLPKKIGHTIGKDLGMSGNSKDIVPFMKGNPISLLGILYKRSGQENKNILDQIGNSVKSLDQAPKGLYNASGSLSDNSAPLYYKKLSQLLSSKSDLDVGVKGFIPLNHSGFLAQSGLADKHQVLNYINHQLSTTTFKGKKLPAAYLQGDYVMIPDVVIKKYQQGGLIEHNFLPSVYQNGAVVNSPKGGGSAWETKSSTEQMIDLLKAGFQSALGMETGTVFDRVPMPSNEIGMISKIGGVSKASKFLKSLFGNNKDNSKRLQKEFNDIYNSVKSRINTPEGQRRLLNYNQRDATLSQSPSYADIDYGYTQFPERMANEMTDAVNSLTMERLKSGTYGPHYSSAYNTVNLPDDLDLSIARPLIRHEIEHSIQQGSPTKIRGILSGLTGKAPSKDYVPRVANSNLKEGLSDPIHAQKYFMTEPQEGGAMLAELQQRLLDEKYIKHAYDEITPELVQSAYDKMDKTALRMFNMIEPTRSNFEKIAKGLNVMAEVATPLVIASQVDKKQRGGPVSPSDSLRHQALKTMQYEALRGSAAGTGLPNWGYGQSQLPYNQVPANWRPPQTQEEAVELYMQEIAPRLGSFQTAMEKGEAGDFLYNTGRDPRIYMLDQYLKSQGQAGLANRGSYNIDTKSPQWDAKKGEFEKEWAKHESKINKLSENDRRILLNKGRDFYYQNIDKVNGQPNPAYENTWFGRIWNTNEYTPFNPYDPRFTPKKQMGGSVDPILDQIYKKYPALKKLGKVALKADSNFTTDKTGAGDIDYFSPAQDTITYDSGFKYAHPALGSHGIVYNPDTNDEQSIMLDLLHGLSSADKDYGGKRQQFGKAILDSKFGSDFEREWSDYNKETGGQNDGKEQFKDNWIDGQIRALMFQGSDEDFAKHRYFKGEREQKFTDPKIKTAFDELQNYLSTEKLQKGGVVNETGYTPGTSTYSNPYNIIPSPNITMNQTPFNVMGYPIYNNKLGNPQLMRPGNNYNFKGANGVLEIPHAQFGLNLGYAPFIDALNDPLSLKRAQLAEMPPMQSDRNLAMNTVPRPSPIFTPPPMDEIPEIEREQVLTLPYDSVYEYKKTPIGWEFRKKGESAWTKARTKSGIEAIERAFGAQGVQSAQNASSAQNTQSAQSVPQQSAPQAPAQAVPQEIRTYGRHYSMDPYNPSALTGRGTRSDYPDNYPSSAQGFANRYFPRVSVNGYSDSRTNEKYNADIMKGYSSLYNPSVYAQSATESATESTPKKTSATSQRNSDKDSDRGWFSYPDPGTIAPYEFGDDAGLGEVLGSTLLGLAPGGGYQGAKLTAQGIKAAIPKLAATLSKLKKGYESFKSSRKATKLIKDIEKTTNVKKAKDIESLLSSGQTSKYQFGGDVQGQEPKIIPIQTEKGEMLYHADGKITDVLAKKKHSKMHDDDITDAVVEGGFVASNDPAMKISKKEAADYVVGYKPMEYSEKSSKAAEPIRFSEMFTKGQMKPSEILKKIRSRTKSDGRTHDVFSARADDENKEIRDMWVEPLKYFTELKKPVEIPQFRYGGMIKKYPGGGDIFGAILGAGTDIAGMLTTAADKRKTLKDVGQYETDNLGALDQNNLLQQGLTFGNYLSQDNTPEFANYDPALNAVNSGYNRILQSMPGRLSQARNANMSQYNSISRNLGKIANPQRASAIAAGLYGRGIAANNQLALQYANQEDAYRSRQSDALANIYGSKALNDQATRTGVRSNRNLLNAGLFKDLGSNATNFLTGKMNVKNTALTARMMARKQANQAISNGFSNLGNNISGIFSAVSQQNQARRRRQQEMDELGDIGQGIFNSPFSWEP